MNRADLIDEVLKLSVNERAGIDERILESLDDLSTQEMEAIWMEEAVQRDFAQAAGELSFRPAADVVAQIKASLK